MRSIRCILVLVAASIGAADSAVAQHVGKDAKSSPSPSKKPLLAAPDSAALDWLRCAEAALGNVEQIPYAFDEEIWAHWMVQSYLDLNRPKDALAFAVRFQKHFDMAFVRNAVRCISYQLACEGKFKDAHDAAQLLYSGIAANPHVRQHDVYVDLLIDLAALEARAGNFASALRTAKSIPEKGNSNWATARADAFGYIALAYARAGDTKGIRAIAAEFVPRDNDWQQVARLIFATELAKAGAFAEAEQLAATMPATMRDTFYAGEAVELSMAGKFSEVKTTIAKLPRREQREAAWRRVAAAVSFEHGTSAAIECVHGNEDAELAGTAEVISESLAWMGKTERSEVVSTNPFGLPVSSHSSPGPSKLDAILREANIDKAFPQRSVPRGGADPFSPMAFLEINDVDARETIAIAKEIVGKPWDEAILRERIQSEEVSVTSEDFGQQVKTYTALAVVASVIGDKAKTATLAASAVAAAERIDFRHCGSHTSFLLPTLVHSGRSDLALQYLRRLLSVQTLEKLSAANVAHAMVAAGDGARVHEVLAIVGNDTDRAAVCLGAARGCISITRPVAKLPLVANEWDLIAKLKIRGDDNFPRSEWDDRDTGYLGSLGHGHPMWLESKTWPAVSQMTQRIAKPLANGETP